MLDIKLAYTKQILTKFRKIIATMSFLALKGASSSEPLVVLVRISSHSPNHPLTCGQGSWRNVFLKPLRILYRTAINTENRQALTISR